MNLIFYNYFSLLKTNKKSLDVYWDFALVLDPTFHKIKNSPVYILYVVRSHTTLNWTPFQGHREQRLHKGLSRYNRHCCFSLKYLLESKEIGLWLIEFEQLGGNIWFIKKAILFFSVSRYWRSHQWWVDGENRWSGQQQQERAGRYISQNMTV